MTEHMFDTLVDWHTDPAAEAALNDAIYAATLAALDDPDTWSDDEWIPTGLDGLMPDSLAPLLAHIDSARLSGHDQIAVLRAQQRLVSYFTAEMYRSMNAVVDTIAAEDDSPEACPEEAAAAEIGCALRLTRRSADAELLHALDLRRRLPQVWAALARGAIDPRRAKTMVSSTTHLSVAEARGVIDSVIEEAPELTTGQLRAAIRRRCLESHPDEAAQRYHFAVDQRRVAMEPTVDGTASIQTLDVAPHRAAAAMRHVNRLARAMCGGQETRSMDQLRADIVCDLLAGRSIEGATGASTRSGRGMVDIHVDLTTLAEISQMPGELAGYGPIAADIARQIAAAQQHAEWRVTVTDPDTGDIVLVGTTRYRPSAQQQRQVQATYHACVWPGCRIPARDSDLDHTTPFADRGPTEPDNLAPLCRHHHRIRHRWGWRYKRLKNGDHRWTSRLGHIHIAPRKPP